MVELVCAMAVMSVGILATYGMLHAGIFQIKRAGTVSTAAALADSEMEGFRAVKYETIGLASSDISAADSTYTGSSGGAYMAISTPVNQVNSTVVVAKCPATPCTNFVPTKTSTGADGRSYRVDTYITWEAVATSGGVAGRNIKRVTIIVRKSGGTTVYAKVVSSFDQSTGI
jgi:Tfp pilus assembly protein PilV